MAELGRLVIPVARKEKHVGDGIENNSKKVWGMSQVGRKKEGRKKERRRKEGRRKTEWETLTVVADNTQRKRCLHLRKQSGKKMRGHRGLREDRDRQETQKRWGQTLTRTQKDGQRGQKQSGRKKIQQQN